MLSRLHISNYVLIDSLEIDFPKGLVIISGPTGAGKSILVGALSLLMGGKADSSVISPGKDSCVVEADFSFEDTSLDVFCNENDIDCCSGNLTIRRVVSLSGRSRSFINDEPVTLPVLERLSKFLLDVHSQHDALLLTDRHYQLSVLDNFASNAELLSRCAQAWNRMRQLLGEVASLEEKLRTASGESEFNASLLSQLEEAKLVDGELEELEAEQYQLAHTAQLKELFSGALSLYESDDSGHQGIDTQLVELKKILARLSEIMPSFSSAASRVESARIELKDISDDLEQANEKTGCSPERLEWIDNRLSLIYSLLKRHNCQTEAQLIARRDELRSLVTGTGDLEDRLLDLKNELETSRSEYSAICSALHESRSGSCEKFAALVSEGLSFMELDKAVFRVSLSPSAPSASGTDEVQFLFSSNAGISPAPVAKCASGGELSRIMLSLKQLMCGFMNLPTVIFDEIDTGVSGSVADKMGSVIASMGKKMQVFAITHLPQVAAKADAHYLVTKNQDTGSTVSTLVRLDDGQRILEIARMLSGAALTPEAIANAKSLVSTVK